MYSAPITTQPWVHYNNQKDWS